LQQARTFRLYNRGNAVAKKVSVDLLYKPENHHLDPNRPWQSVANASNEIQTITNVTLPAAGGNWFTVNWAPPANAASRLCVKAMIHSQDDLNADNNIAIGCFVQSGSPATSAVRP